MNNDTDGVRISSSALLKPVPMAGFIVNKNKLANSLPRIFHYRKPKIVKGKSWYIEYYYRIPFEVRKFYDGKEWLRFRIREDINRRTGPDKLEYAEWLRAEIEETLMNGYNPFKPEKEFVEKEMMGIEEERDLGAKDAILLFLEVWEKRGLDPASMQKYNRVSGRLIEWLERKSIPYINIHDITQDHIEQFLNDLRQEKGFSNREYNNTYDFTRTIFNFLLKKNYIQKSPCAGIQKLKSKSSKHRYFDQKNREAIVRVMMETDPYLYFACQTVYYLCIRSEKELMNLKIGNIHWSENKILAEVGKGNTERYIPMDENMKGLFIEKGIDKYPSDYFVFGIKEKPAAVSFGKGFFSKRFRKARELAGLDDKFTIYGFKHSRVVDLKQSGATDADIMSLTGHKDFSAYATYLRDLGISANAENLNRLGKKI